MGQPDDIQTTQADLAFARKLMREPLLEREKELELASRWRENHDEEALHHLVTPYARLVISTALRFRHHGLAIGDLIQEGNLGLMQAAERFDPGRDVRFSTYAKWWIRSFIQDFILRNWSIVRTGSTTSQKQLFFNLRRLRAQIVTVGTEYMQIEDRQKIAEALGVTIRDVEDMEYRIASSDLSLSAPKSSESDEEWIDSLADHRINPEKSTINSHDNIVRERWLEEAMAYLSSRERIIIMARRLTDYPMTLEALGSLLNISKERVRQLEARAIRKLRHVLMDTFHANKDLIGDS